ncbi:hypothetical protein [Paludibaculum fermentans]|uniref:Uncharacterized protein n=1 Tax=Paludibaculum fermentans TaxID=1473598 RepID=A0A7S7SMK5_PALFE|nr:hypothetical protein [Paludibaculum fermentans]QOY90023.1 hypothetical protein IRI77_08740 [Paludibaculum fermentans]
MPLLSTLVYFDKMPCTWVARGVFLYVALVGIAGGQSFGQSFCAFEVTVRSSLHRPMAGVGVGFIGEHRTTLYESISDKYGVVRFCDGPLMPIDIVVGNDICGSVLLRNIKARWPNSARMSVVYDDRACDHLALSADIVALLRVQDEEGRPISGAQFADAAKRPGTSVSDEYGRVFRVCRRGELLQGTIQKRGWLAAKISHVCGDDVEIRTVLRLERTTPRSSKKQENP